MRKSNRRLVYDTVHKRERHQTGQDELSLPIIKGNLSLPEFYSHFEPIYNEDSHTFIEKLAEHQEEVWNHQFDYLYRAYPKSQKIYLSTTFIFEDIYHALTDAMGMEIIITAQSDDKAKKHLQDFKKYVLTSEYHDYLITRPIPELGLGRDEVTKATMAVMHNPRRPFYPTYIYALPYDSGSLMSYKHVKHIHASDVTRSKKLAALQREAFIAMMSRVSISKGSIVIEAPHRGLDTSMNEQMEKYNSYIEAGNELLGKTKAEQQGLPFFVKTYDYNYGIKSGAFSETFIQGEREKHGVLFDMYYAAKPFASDISWFFPEHFQHTSSKATEFFAEV